MPTSSSGSLPRRRRATSSASRRRSTSTRASPPRRRTSGRDWGSETVTIPITRPVLGSPELQAIAEVLESGHLVRGGRVAEFERLVAEQVGVAHAVAVSNGTSALRGALLALGIGPGDDVVVTPYSWIATANVIELCGATPIFVD